MKFGSCVEFFILSLLGHLPVSSLPPCQLIDLILWKCLKSFSLMLIWVPGSWVCSSISSIVQSHLCILSTKLMLKYIFKNTIAGWECYFCPQLKWLHTGILADKVCFLASNLNLWMFHFSMVPGSSPWKHFRVSPSKTPVRPRGPRQPMHWNF